MAKFYTNIIRKLLYGGDSHLRKYEADIVNQFYSGLNLDSQRKFISQLQKLDFVQRSEGERLVTFFDSEDKLKERWPLDIAFYENVKGRGKVGREKVEIEGKVYFGTIEFYKGFLLNIRFNDEMNFLSKKHKREYCRIADVRK